MKNCNFCLPIRIWITMNWSGRSFKTLQNKLDSNCIINHQHCEVAYRRTAFWICVLGWMLLWIIANRLSRCLFWRKLYNPSIFIFDLTLKITPFGILIYSITGSSFPEDVVMTHVILLFCNIWRIRWSDDDLQESRWTDIIRFDSCAMQVLISSYSMICFPKIESIHSHAKKAKSLKYLPSSFVQILLNKS